LINTLKSDEKESSIGTWNRTHSIGNTKAAQI